METLIFTVDTFNGYNKMITEVVEDLDLEEPVIVSAGQLRNLIATHNKLSRIVYNQTINAKQLLDRAAEVHQGEMPHCNQGIRGRSLRGSQLIHAV